MALFIKFDGVDGEAKDKDHKQWSDLLSMSWGVHKAGGGATGQTRRRGVATVDDVNITKELDKSSPKLAEAVLTGKVFPKVEIHNTATYGEGRATLSLPINDNLVFLSVNALRFEGGLDRVFDWRLGIVR